MIIRTMSVLLALFILAPTVSSAADRKMVIQVNSSDPMTQRMALNSAKNLKKMIGKDKVDVEVVVYGPGIGMLSKSGDSAHKVKSMIEHGIRVSVCGGALTVYAKRNGGKELDVIDGITRVPTGAIRILELQEQGYAYLRP